MPLKINKEEFLKKCEILYSNKYLYKFKEIFHFKKIKIEIFCEKHGWFEQTPILHLKCGCPKCSIDTRETKEKELLWENFLKSAYNLYQDKYSYNKESFMADRNKIEITCPLHGPFYKRMSYFLNGHECQFCSGNGSLYRLEKSKNEFVEKANIIHGNKYIYTNVNYINSKNNVDIICKEHGIFSQSPTNHLNFHGCPYCNKKKLFVEDVKKDIKQFYGESANIVNIDNITNSNSILKIEDKKKINIKIKLKTFRSQQTNKIRSASKVYKIKSKFRSRIKNFIKNKIECKSKLNILGCDVSDYLKYLDLYSNLDSNLPFELDHKYPCSAFDLRNEDEISVCFNYRNTRKITRNDNISKNNKILPEFTFLKNKIKNILKIEKLLDNNKIKFKSCNIIDKSYSDIYIEDKNIAIVFYENEKCENGKLLKDKNIFHKNKINLIQIFEDELINKYEIVESRILNKLSLTKNKLYARNCNVKLIDKKSKSIFLNKYHIQGNDKSNIDLGLYYKDELVSVMTFCKSRIALGKRTCDYELSRFCSKINLNVVGGASKLFSYFVQKNNFNKIISYSDIRWGNGNVYEFLGFKKIGKTPPGYYYYKIGDIKLNHRFLFAKHNLSKKFLNFDKNKTEKENCLINGFRQVYNSGNYIYEFNKSN